MLYFSNEFHLLAQPFLSKRKITIIFAWEPPRHFTFYNNSQSLNRSYILFRGLLLQMYVHMYTHIYVYIYVPT